MSDVVKFKYDVSLENKQSFRPFGKELRYLFYCLAVLIVGIAIFLSGFVAGRSSKVCVKQSDGSISEKITLTGASICSIIQKGKNFVISGEWQPKEVTENIDFSLYDDIWYMLQNNYVDSDKFDGQKAYYDSIRGLVSTVGDSHTVFLDPKETKQFEETNEGKYSGIGAEIGMRNNRIVIISPLEGSPASNAGLKPNDAIIKVDDKSLEGMNTYEAATLIKGEKGTKVKLTIMRDDQVFDVEIIRDEIKNSSIEYKGLKDDVAYLRISRFTELNSDTWNNLWDESVKKIIADNPKALIIDLRGNPGGFLDSVLYALDDFLPEGAVKLKEQGRNNIIVGESKVQRKGRLLNIPVVILINGGSASASEIFTGAMQQNGRATVIGTESFGKGSVQNVHKFSDGSSIHITTEKWLLPNGQNLDENNKIIPNEIVEITDEDVNKGVDPQLDKAYEVVK